MPRKEKIMNLKQVKMIGVLGIFILCFLTHYIYEMFPNDLFAIFFPVNESIWEHMKMLFSTTIIYGVFEFILLRYFKIKFNNFFFSLWIMGIAGIIIYLALFMPLYYIFGENKIIVFLILIITIMLMELISYFILNAHPRKNKILPIILIGVTYVIFGYLTYYPPEFDLFYDTLEEKYGINNYNI